MNYDKQENDTRLASGQRTSKKVIEYRTKKYLYLLTLLVAFMTLVILVFYPQLSSSITTILVAMMVIISLSLSNIRFNLIRDIEIYTVKDGDTLEKLANTRIGEWAYEPHYREFYLMTQQLNEDIMDEPDSLDFIVTGNTIAIPIFHKPRPTGSSSMI